eukprot:Pgem_evm1s18283
MGESLEQQSKAIMQQIDDPTLNLLNLTDINKLFKEHKALQEELTDLYSLQNVIWNLFIGGFCANIVIIVSVVFIVLFISWFSVFNP